MKTSDDTSRGATKCPTQPHPPHTAVAGLLCAQSTSHGLSAKPIQTAATTATIAHHSGPGGNDATA